MAANFPTSLDNGTSLPNPTATNNTNSPSHAGLHDNENGAVIAVETKIGTGASTPTSNTALVGNGTGTSSWTSTLTSFTITTPTVNGSGGLLTLPAGPDTLVGRATTDTLTNKTLTSPTITTPTIASITNSGTLTLPTSSDTLVGRATTDTLTNKTITATSNSVSYQTLTNPYKFRVHLATAQTISSNTFTKIPFDTKDFDTGTNFDVATNHRFTAPVAGFYQFNAAAENLAGSAARNMASIYVNGVEYSRGNDARTDAIATGGAGVSDFIQLNATDFVEIFFFTSGTNIAGTSNDGRYATYFSGFLVSVT